MYKSTELHKVCNVQSGGTPSRKNPEFYVGDIPWAKISDLEKSGNGFITETEELISSDGLRAIGNRVFERGTLFLAMYGSVGKTAITRERMACNQAILGIRPLDDNQIDLTFLKYWFTFSKEKLIDSARGVALKNLSATMVKGLEIPLPPLKTQQRIAAILDDAQALKQKTEQLLKEYDALAQSIFLDMFGDPVTNPKGWKKSATIENSKCIVPGRDKPKSFTGNIPWITTNDLIQLGRTKKSIKNIALTEEEILEVKAKVIPANSVIMTCVGDLGIISINEAPIVVNQQLHVFICDKNLNNTFLMYSLFHQKPYMHKMASKTTVPYMNKTVCNNVPTILPPLTLQNQFAKKIALIEQQKELAKKELKESEDLFNCLLQKAFKGELV